MATFRITELVVYEVEADSAEEAEQLFLNAESSNEFFVCVEEREVEEL
jgi:hypothetical protein